MDQIRLELDDLKKNPSTPDFVERMARVKHDMNAHAADTELTFEVGQAKLRAAGSFELADKFESLWKCVGKA